MIELRNFERQRFHVGNVIYHRASNIKAVVVGITEIDSEFYYVLSTCIIDCESFKFRYVHTTFNLT